MACDFRRIVENVKIRAGVFDAKQIDEKLRDIEVWLKTATWRHRQELLDERDFLETSLKILNEGRRA